MESTQEKQQTKLTQWGNSKATRIPANIVKQLDLKDNQELSIEVKDSSIIMTPVKKRAKDIHELFAGWEDDGIRETELDWGESKGNELEW